MRSIEISAKTVEEAVQIALKELNLTNEDVKIDVLEQPNKGFLGILGSKNALVRVEEIFKPEKVAKEFLDKIFKSLKLNPNFDVENNKDYIKINITGENLGILIGRRGDTLDSIQFLLNLVVNKNVDNENRVKVIIDVEGYRKKREETLINLGQKLAQKVKRTKSKVVLEPMNPQERRIIHLALQDDSMINTYSEGEEPYRKVVIVPKR